MPFNKGGTAVITPLRKRLWYVEGLTALRHKVGDYFWAVSSSEARDAWAQRFGGIPSHWEFIK